MFVLFQVLSSRGSPEPYTVHEEVLRIDMIQRMRPIEVPGIDEPCTELTLENEELIFVRGSIRDTIALLNDDTT